MHPLSPGDGQNVFPSSSLSEVFLSTVKVSWGRKLFFFTDNPSGFPSSGNKHLRLGYAAETRNCRRKDCLILKLPGAAAAQTGHLAYPLVLLCRWQGKRTKSFLPQKNSFGPRYLPARRKTEFEWEGINRIRPSPELGMLKIQSRFPVAVWRGICWKQMVPISIFIFHNIKVLWNRAVQKIKGLSH